MTTSGTYYVYEHWRLDRDECFYVGKGRGNRAYSMKSRNRYHKAIMAKLSREGFAMEVRIVACGLTEEESFILEKERIKFWRENGSDLTNMTNGGEGISGISMPESQKQKISFANKGKKRTDETKRKMSEAFKGRVVSELTRKKISNKLKGQPGAFKGCKHTEETKRVLSEIAKKRGMPKLTKEQQEKASSWHRGRKRSPETCANISKAKIKSFNDKKAKVLI